VEGGDRKEEKKTRQAKCIFVLHKKMQKYNTILRRS
jgi:hypothetical protein